MSLSSFRQWFQKHSEQNTRDFFTFLRFKSISADPAYANDVNACAKWLLNYMKPFLKTELLATDTFPIVYAESAPKKKTLLMYGHYDVQPVDPLNEWLSDPFEPTVRDGKIFARGAVDDKGQIFYAILAAKAFHELGMELPIQIKFCIEGEEESASTGLSHSLPRLKEKLKADSLLVVDFSQFDETMPAVSLGARGLAALEVKLTGSHSDMHSGEMGGIAYNPNRALVQLLSKLWDEKGRVTVPGFYDGIVHKKEKVTFRHGKEHYTKAMGVHAFCPGDIHENNLFLPTMEINGVGGGYTGKGVKTVIPKEAIAKITMRLVPGQDPEKICALVSDFLKKEAVQGMQVAVTSFGGEPAFRGNGDSDLTRAVIEASSEATGLACQKVLSGASIPIMARMTETLECDIAGMGYCKSSDNIHAPNEHFDWDRVEKGFLTVAGILKRL